MTDYYDSYDSYNPDRNESSAVLLFGSDDMCCSYLSCFESYLVSLSLCFGVSHCTKHHPPHLAITCEVRDRVLSVLDGEEGSGAAGGCQSGD